MLGELWSVPVITLGEFDCLEGPRAFSVSEYYAYSEVNASGPQCLKLCASYGNVFVSPRVASGSLQPDQKNQMKSVVARVLSSNESSEESVVMLDPAIGVIASTSFSLSDILARGEKRRFCIIVTHPHGDELIQRWPLLSSVLRILLDDWIERTMERLRLEYATFPDLERQREEARKGPLRPLMTLLSRENETEHDVSRYIHLFFESALPTVFSFEPLPFHDCTGEVCLDAVRHHLELQSELYDHTVEIIIDGSQSSTEKLFFTENGKVVTMGQPPIVKPLVVWLLEFLHDHDNASREIHMLLYALFTGNQIIIDGDRSDHCANLALSLSQILPRSLRRVTIFADEYVMPYRSRIVSFNGSISELHPCGFGKSEGTNSVLLNLAGFHSGCVVDVNNIGIIKSVKGYDEGWNKFSNSGNPSSKTTEDGFNPTIISKINDLLSSHATEKLTSGLCRAIQAQIEQIVNEYVMRGRVYGKLFQRHEMERNQELLRIGKEKEDREGYFSSISSVVRCLFAAAPQAIRHFSSSSNGVQKRINRGDSVSFSRSLRGSGMEPWAATLADHEILLFLGSAAGIL